MADLKANVVLSSCVAITGIALPIVLSFVLIPLVSATKLQAFAAGAALCSTSLGTTFTVLATSGLVHSRLGVVLTSAAMLDDVVGLIMVQVISNLGDGQVRPITVLRPIIVSCGLVLVLCLICRFVLRPLRNIAVSLVPVRPAVKETLKRSGKSLKVVLDFLVLTGLVAGATYAGTSNLFAAYLAALLVSWLDGLLNVPGATALEIYNESYRGAVELILKPFFFVGRIPSSHQCADRPSGFNRLLHPHFANVPREGCVERGCVRNSYDDGEASMRCLVAGHTVPVSLAHVGVPKETTATPVPSDSVGRQYCRRRNKSSK